MIASFASLVGALIGIASFAVGLKMRVITSGIKKYKPIINKKKTQHDRIVVLAKYKWNTIEVLISKAFIHSNTGHDNLVAVSNVLRKYDYMKEAIENLKTSVVYRKF